LQESLKIEHGFDGSDRSKRIKDQKKIRTNPYKSVKSVAYFETFRKTMRMDDRTQQQIFDDWLHEHKGIFFKIVRAYAFTPHDQDDLFQEISLGVWKSIPDFRGEAKPSTWFYRVALFTAISWVRKETKQPATQPIAEVEHALTVNPLATDPRLDWLYAQIAQLDPVNRSISLLLLEGYSYKEMAEIVGISESNIGVRIHRIKAALVRRKEEIRA